MHPPRQTAYDGMKPPRPADTPPMDGMKFNIKKKSSALGKKQRMNIRKMYFFRN